MIETAARFVVRTARIGQSKDTVLRQASAADARLGCAMCAGAMSADDRCITVRDLPRSFTAQPQLAAARLICESCIRLGHQDWTQKYATAMVTDAGVFPFRKLVDIAYWMAHPPDTPYVMVVSTAKVQHVYWTAQVSLPGDVALLCLGGRNELVRYPRLRKAWSVAREFTGRLTRAQDEAPTRAARAALPNPHGLLVGSFDSLHSNELSRHATPAEREAIAGLTAGERWLLARIQGQDPTAGVRPEPLFQPG